jgi:hypothetical protein
MQYIVYVALEFAIIITGVVLLVRYNNNKP